MVWRGSSSGVGPNAHPCHPVGAMSMDRASEAGPGTYGSPGDLAQGDLQSVISGGVQLPNVVSLFCFYRALPPTQYGLARPPGSHLWRLLEASGLTSGRSFLTLWRSSLGRAAPRSSFPTTTHSSSSSIPPAESSQSEQHDFA